MAASTREQIQKNLARQTRVALAVGTDPAARDRVARAVAKRARALRRRVAGIGPAAAPLPNVALPQGPVVRPDLVVATILDPFSELAFRYEWVDFRQMFIICGAFALVAAIPSASPGK